ncbi:MAG: polyisoprenoid-binding protein YceI [Paraglaciecola sp.]|jgi:polyisoprenoid-binding protein YceI
MKKMNMVCIAFYGVLIMVTLSTKVSANWRLADSGSEVYFISTKNQHISEIHQFSQLNGSLTDAGVLRIEINLASVETGIDIRNTRMREKLFLVDRFPNATLDAVLPEELMKLEVGHSVNVELPVKLTIMTTEKLLNIAVQVSKTMDGKLIATSSKPTLIGAADFGLKSGVELLQQLAGLSSIGLSVPVTFNLTFEPVD